jgi:hypothetical protein
MPTFALLHKSFIEPHFVLDYISVAMYHRDMKNTLSKLTETQKDQLIRYTDRMFYAAIHEGFDSKAAREMAAMAAERKAKEMAVAK